MSFSIDLASEKIYNPKTRQYFKEVHTSYVNGNYRSSVVMLWSVAISDLLYKLIDLRDIYNDNAASDILTEIQNYQLENPTGSQWETTLVIRIRERTQLLSNSEYQNLENLRQERHLSAHPVLDNVTDILHSPNYETTRALIRNTLEGVLLKPPIFTRQIVNEFLTDLAAKQDLLLTDEDLKSYLEARYFGNLIPEIEQRLFRTLWSFVFNRSNEDIDANRNINFRALRILFSRQMEVLKVVIQEDIEYYSSVGDEDKLEYMTRFLKEFPSVFNLLSDTARIPLRTYVESEIALFMQASFLYESQDEYFSELFSKLDLESENMREVNKSLYRPPNEQMWMELVDSTLEPQARNNLLTKGIEIYISSTQFAHTDTNYESFIKPCLDEFSHQQLLALIQGIENNDQTHSTSNRTARPHNKKIKERCNIILGEDFDYSEYPNFVTSFTPPTIISPSERRRRTSQKAKTKDKKE